MILLSRARLPLEAPKAKRSRTGSVEYKRFSLLIASIPPLIPFSVALFCKPTPGSPKLAKLNKRV